MGCFVVLVKVLDDFLGVLKLGRFFRVVWSWGEGFGFLYFVIK